LSIQVDIYLPTTANEDKKQLLKMMGANLVSHGTDAAVTEVTFIALLCSQVRIKCVI
jgi:cysteine synthase